MASAPEENVAYKPFTSAASGTDVEFWRSYTEARPSPPDEFFEIIYDYHLRHGGSHAFELAHDVGTGPGNIAARLASKFGTVIASDVNESALASGPQLMNSESAAKITFVACPGEELAGSEKLPPKARGAQADLVVVSECMPLLDAERSIRGFSELLKPGGTLAIYFYGRPFFVEEPYAARCNELYANLATHIIKLYWPFKGSPGFPFHARSAEALVSWLDNIAVPGDEWTDVERQKWNSDRPLLFNDKSGYDFDLVPKSRIETNEKVIERRDREFWPTQWNISQVKSYLNSNYPRNEQQAGEGYGKILNMLAELEEAMGGRGSVRQISWPVVLVMATKPS